VSEYWRAGLMEAAPALQVALGMVLLVSGIGKARDRHSLVAGALRYRVLAPGVVRPAAALLPFVEVSLGAALLLGVWHRPTAWLAAALFAIFAVAVGINLRRGRAIPCHCFGASAADRIGPLSLARLLILVLLALIVARSDPADGLRSMVSGPVDRTLSLASVAVAAVWVTLMAGPLQLLIGETAAVRSASSSNRHQPAIVAAGGTNAPLGPSLPTLPTGGHSRSDHE
jgi:uncharacterized membrane protein YphA (DoxX/SURF4 family)